MAFRKRFRGSTRKVDGYPVVDADRPLDVHVTQRDIAKGKPDAESRLITHITSGEKAKFPDGHEEEHAIVKSKDPDQIKNLVDWILSL